MYRSNRRALLFGLVLVLLMSLLSTPLAAYAEMPTAKACVKAIKPVSVELDVVGTVDLQPGQTLKLTHTVLPDEATNKKVTFSSSRKSVAKVSSSGNVTALKPGTAKITVKTKLAGKKASVKVVVGYKYRFYGISNGLYKKLRNSNLKNYANDIASMNSIYGTARFDGGKVKRSYRKNLTASGIKSYLNGIAKNKAIEADDVTIVYYSGHGADAGFGSGYAGAFVGVNATGKGTTGLVTVDTVQYYLDQIAGDVVVIVDSCLSGQFIETKGLRSKAMANTEAALYNQSVINAFARNSSKGFSGSNASMSAKTLTTGQYHVITACAPLEVSYSADFGKAGIPIGWRSYLTVFAQEATAGIKKLKQPSLLADANGDKAVSLVELHSYVAPSILSATQGAQDGPSNVLIHPAGDTFPVFAIN